MSSSRTESYYLRIALAQFRLEFSLKHGNLPVSIPERVWGGLEQSDRAHGTRKTDVSIPERVWGGLERGGERLGVLQDRFQSLRGFGVGWSDPKRSPSI